MSLYFPFSVCLPPLSPIMETLLFSWLFLPGTEDGYWCTPMAYWVCAEGEMERMMFSTTQWAFPYGSLTQETRFESLVKFTDVKHGIS